MKRPLIRALRPRRVWARPGASVEVDVEVDRLPTGSATLTVELLDVDHVVATRTLDIDARTVRHTVAFELPRSPRHGYGVAARLTTPDASVRAASAVEALEGWWQSPRHAAITDFEDPDRSAEATRALRDWHVTVTQHYDWMWRHYRYEAPDGATSFTDALGRRVSHDAVRSSIAAGHEVGIAALAYGSVYGAEREHVERHPDDRVFDASGVPLSLGETFFINDIRPGSPWRQRLLREYALAIEGLGFDGIHMDTYGEPYAGYGADGGAIDFAALYPGLIAEAAELVAVDGEEHRVLFNCVDGFPLDSVAPAPAACLYLELWPERCSYADVVGWIDRARAAAAGRPVVIAAYARTLRDRPSGPRRPAAFETVLRLGSAIAAAGAYHHCLAEGERLLVEGYYPAAVPLRAAERRALRALWRFGARYVHLLSDADLVADDHEGVSLAGPDGMAIPLADVPVAGAVWMRATRTPGGRRVLHLVDLADLDGDRWDEPVPAPPRRSGLRLEWPGVGSVVAASPWTDGGHPRPLRHEPSGAAGWRLPAFVRWLVLVET